MMPVYGANGTVFYAPFNETYQNLFKEGVKVNPIKESPSGTNIKITGMDKKVILSTIWIFVVFNYLYCDVISLMDAGLLRQYLAGKVGTMEMTQGFLLGAGILMEISIAMVLLSRVLKYRANRWANIIAGAITTVVQVLSLFAGSAPTAYYTFFSIIEIASTALIVWFAWKWANPEGSLNR